jgi:hypothetical protein
MPSQSLPTRPASAHEVPSDLCEAQEAWDVDLANAGMGDYLPNLEDYEDRLARGEIQW